MGSYTLAAAHNSNEHPSAKADHRVFGLGWWLIGLASLAMVLLWAAGDTVQVLLRYDRTRILSGEYWRLMTGHWVHGGLRHMALNVLAAWVIALLFVRTYSTGQWLLILLGSVLAIDVGFLFREPQLEWYVGASGVLHGALAAGAIAWWREGSKSMALALTVIVVGKLAWEQFQGALPLVGDMVVIVDAHLYGALGGFVTAGCIQLAGRYSVSTRPLPPL
jgi:rhomboid family GlyGly-CTERM serine protease